MAGIYIHIPFCRQICAYCDFHHSAALSQKEQMLAAISGELRARCAELDGRNLRTLYLGGGTPSVCTAAEIATLVELVRELWPDAALEEVTLEANPDDLTPEYLGALRAAGIDRLSIGIQSFHDPHLQQMNRRHAASGAIEAVRAAQAAGFDNLTIDLMYGLPFMSLAEWRQNLEQAVALGVQHISAYHLTIEPRTVFGRRELQPVDEVVSEVQFALLREVLCGAGFEHYEVSNFAVPSRRARHNTSYWEGEPYLGVGPSAHSYDGALCRSWNVSHNGRYLEGVPPKVEQLSATDRLNEYLMTRLRTSEGVDVEEMKRLFGVAVAEQITLQCLRRSEAGQLLRTSVGYAISPERFLTSDYLISSLFM